MFPFKIMELREYWEPFLSGGKSADIFVCKPDRIGENKPGILLIQEIWGVDEHIIDLARRYATAGYLTVAPDLYSKGGKEPAKSNGRITELKSFLDRVPMRVIMDPDGRKKAIEKEPEDKAKRLIETMDAIFSGRDIPAMVKTLEDAVHYLKSEQGVSNVGTVGYCMGGALSFIMASNKDVSASVVFYGTAPEESVMKNINAPVLGLYGGEDHRISDAAPGVADNMKKLGKSYEYKIYEGAQHAFFNDTRASYGYEASRDAWGKTLEFFRANLH